MQRSRIAADDQVGAGEKARARANVLAAANGDGNGGVGGDGLRAAQVAGAAEDLEARTPQFGGEACGHGGEERRRRSVGGLACPRKQDHPRPPVFGGVARARVALGQELPREARRGEGTPGAGTAEGLQPGADQGVGARHGVGFGGPRSVETRRVEVARSLARPARAEHPPGAGSTSDQRAAEEGLQVEGSVEALGTQRAQAAKETPQGAAPRGRAAKARAVQAQNAVDGRMPPEQVRGGRFEGPHQAGIGQGRAQAFQRGEGVDGVAERAEPDEQEFHPRIMQ